MTTYRATAEIPPLVRAAMDLAREIGFPHSCSPEVGRLLRVLAGGVRGGVAGEIGTGCGVGAAWIVSGLAPEVPFVTVEIDAARAAAARRLLAPYPYATVLTGDWRQMLPRGPFALLFADGGKAKQEEPGALLDALAPGGLIVLDDLTPEEHWPPEWRGRRDPVRDAWLNNPRLAATEVLVTPRAAVILAARARDASRRSG